MKVYGQLENAQLENKAADYSVAPVGRIWWNTATSKVKLDDGTNIRAMLRNDGFCVHGNSATASQNIRLHRGAAGVLQFVTGDDVTAEGTLSTTLNQTSGRLENYTTGTLPANGNAGRAVWDTTVSSLKVDSGSGWTTIGPTGTPSPRDTLNYSLTATVAASALTITLKTAGGNTPSSGDPVTVSFRSATAATGTSSQVTAVASTTLVISSGSTLGHRPSFNNYIYIYAINNAGTIELAASTTRMWDEYSTQNTTAEGGAGAADLSYALYSTSARSGVGIRLIARLKSNQATPGTWATAISEISLFGSNANQPNFQMYVMFTAGSGFGSSSTCIRRITGTQTIVPSTGTAVTFADSATAGSSFTINEDGLYNFTYTDSRSGGGAYFGFSLNSSQGTTSIRNVNPAGERLTVCSVNAGIPVNQANWTGRLLAGDIVRPHGDGLLDEQNPYFGVVVTKLAD